jgi:hypothetical protein
MSIAMARGVLLWCSVINYALLLLWVVLYLAARNWLVRVHGGLFHLKAEMVDTVNYALIVLYKIGILLFNFIPFIVLWLIG